MTPFLGVPRVRRYRGGMNKHDERFDAYAETHILEVRPAALRAVARESDSLELYAEYARVLEREEAAAGRPAKPKRATQKRAAAKRRR